MPLSPSGCIVDNNLDVDVHNEVDARSRECSHILALSSRRCCIIDPGQFLMGGPPMARRGDGGAILLQYRLPLTASFPLHITGPEAGFWGGVYGNNMISHQISLNISSYPNKWSHSWAMRKLNKTITINNGDRETTPLFWEKNRLAATRWLELTLRNKNLKINLMA